MTPRRPQLGGNEGVVFEVRSYDEILQIAEELQSYNGYLHSSRMQERNNIQMRFDSARRKFVYELCQDRPNDAEQALPGILEDLDRIAAEGSYGYDAVELVRNQLTKHIPKQARSNPFQRFVTRWGPPTMMTILFGAGIYFVYLRFSGDF